MANLNAKVFMFDDDGEIPNNPKLPLLVYPEVFINRMVDVTQVLHGNNWTNSWTGSVHDFHHYHSVTHEVLAVIGGNAKIQFGGKNGEELKLAAGDVVVIPAGVGHKKVEASHDFEVIGAYPDGKEFDMKTGKPGEHGEAVENIAKVPLPEQDPVFAEEGPLKEIWIED